MKPGLLVLSLFASLCLSGQTAAWAGQAPGAESDPEIPISHHDRVYSAEQFSNTVSVTDPVDNKLLGVIRLGDPQPANLSPLYRGQVLTGLEPKQPYVLALATQATGGGVLEPLAAFTTNPAGAAIVNAVGPIRQIVRGEARIPRRYLVIVSGTPGQLGATVQVQAP